MDINLHTVTVRFKYRFLTRIFAKSEGELYMFIILLFVPIHSFFYYQSTCKYLPFLGNPKRKLGFIFFKGKYYLSNIR